jgi:hypothetical protein
MSLPQTMNASKKDPASTNIINADWVVSEFTQTFANTYMIGHPHTFGTKRRPVLTWTRPWRLGSRECDARGKAVVSIKWAEGAGT